MTMYTVISEAHSGWRWLVLLIVAVAVVRALYGWFRDSEWGVWDNRLGISLPIMLDIQLLLGIVLWIMGQQWIGYNPLAAWEHPVTMILAVVAAHVTWSRIKKQTVATQKFRTATIGYAVTAFVLALGIARITHVV
jgi:hypothetical protein